MLGKLDEMTTIVLVNELNYLMKEIQDIEVKNIQLYHQKRELEDRYNEILDELYKRFPDLTNDVNMQKRKVKKKYGRNTY